TNCRLAARKPERSKMRDPREPFNLRIDAEELTAPDRSVRTVATAIPRNTQRGTCDRVFGHARENVRVMMLNGGHVLRRAAGILRRNVIGMKIAGDAS